MRHHLAQRQVVVARGFHGDDFQRDDAVRVFSLRRNVSSQTNKLAEASGDARFVASLTFEHAPVRLESPVSGSGPERSACVAWSAANAGVLYYAGAATGGDLLVLDATRARGDGAAAGARTSVVKLPLFEPGDSHDSHDSHDLHDSSLNRTRCVAVASSRRSAGDLVAVGGDGGCVFFEIAARETAGFAAASSAASDAFPALESGSRDRREMTPTRVSRFVSPNPVVSVDWAEPPNGDGGFSDDVRGEVRSATIAFLAAGAEVHAFDDEALFEAP